MVDAAAPAISAQDEQDYEQTMSWLVSPPRMQQPKTGLLLFSLVAFIGASLLQGGGSVVEIAMLVGVILFHELGHMIAMRIVGYRDVRIFFIPFFGGAAAGNKRGVARWKEGVVLLCGPLPGIVLGTVLAYVGGHELVRLLALQLIIVNAINLLPIAPLDGGQLFQLLLFSRQRHLELIFVGCTATLLAIGAVLAQLWVLAIVGVFILLSLPNRKRILDLALPLRGHGLPSDPAALDDAQRRELYRIAIESLPPQRRERWRGKPQPKAQMIEQILERATQQSASATATAAQLGLWLAGLVVAFMGLAAAIGPSWRPYTNDEGHFAIDMPAQPAVKEQLGFKVATASVGRKREYSVMWNQSPDPPAALAAIRAGFSGKPGLVELTAGATDQTFTFREGDNVVLTRLYASPTRIYMIVAFAPGDEADSHRFSTSFHVLP